MSAPVAGASVPNSSGTAPPRTPVPEGACDAHLHIIDPRFLPAGTACPEGSTLADYRLLQSRLGLRRAVLVQAKNHRTDNAALLDALAQLGPDGRGIAVVLPDVSDTELKRLDAGGVRGLRFSVWNAANGVTTIDMIAPLARRIADLGWHAQIHMSGAQIVANSDLLRHLPCPVVFDHMGRLPPDLGATHPGFRVIADMLESGRAWVKLSGAYLNTHLGPPEYADATRLARAFVALAPERLVWGSDWPHVTEKTAKPDDALLLDLLETWSGDAALRRRILVDNPCALYGFS